MLITACTLWVTFAGRHVDLSPSQTKLLAQPAVRIVFFFAVIFLATQNVALAAAASFLVWLLLDVALDERRAVNMAVPWREVTARADAYAQWKKVLAQEEARR